MDHDSSLPRLILIADRFTQAGIAERVMAAVEAGVRWVYLRDHQADEMTFHNAAQMLVRRLQTIAPDTRISVNARQRVARVLGVGLHLGKRGPAVGDAREALGLGVCIGFSAHGQVEAQAAVAAGADYLFLSPIFPTCSKPGHPGIGPAALEAVCTAFPRTPLFALGGITPDRVPPCLQAGAYGVAVLSGILHAEDPTTAARMYLNPLRAIGNPTSNIQHPA